MESKHLSVQSGTETGSPTLQFGVPTVGFEMTLEVAAPLIRWDKADLPSVYFYAKGVTRDGVYKAFPDMHPGPEYVQVKPAGRLLEMGEFPPSRLFIRRDDPNAHLAEVFLD